MYRPCLRRCHQNFNACRFTIYGLLLLFGSLCVTLQFLPVLPGLIVDP
eukprot:SAG22_NODE_8972_length_617_cov_1.667954_2_plen_48_part_00